MIRKNCNAGPVCLSWAPPTKYINIYIFIYIEGEREIERDRESQQGHLEREHGFFLFSIENMDKHYLLVAMVLFVEVLQV